MADLESKRPKTSSQPAAAEQSENKALATASLAVSRRDIGKLATTTAGAVLAGSVMPKEWFPPIVQVAFLPAHAHATGPVRPGDGVVINLRDLPKTEVPSNNEQASQDPIEPDDGTEPGAAGTGGSVGGGDIPQRGGGEQGAEGQPDSNNPAGTGAPSCTPTPGSLLQPTSVQTVTTPTGAFISWNGNGEHAFRVEVYGYGDDYDSSSDITRDVIGNSVTIDGLEPCTDYYVYVTAVRCGIESFSTYDYFRTPLGPNPPSGFQIESTYCDSFWFGWNYTDCATYYEVQVSEDNGATWATQTTSYNGGSVVGLCPDTVYMIRVRAVQHTSGRYFYSGFSAPLTVKTKPVGSEYCEEEPSECGLDRDHDDHVYEEGPTKTL